MKKIINHILNKNTDSPILLDVFYEETQTKKPVIIFCHGFKSYKDWGAYNQMAEFFASKGFVFLKFNFSHNGGTMTQPIDFPDLEKFAKNTFSKEQNDLDEVISFIENNDSVPFIEKNTEQIYITGHSRGGASAIIKAIHDKRIKKIATLGSVIEITNFSKSNEFVEDWKKKGVTYVPNLRTNQLMPLNFSLYEDFMENQDKFDIPKIAHLLSIPQLIIHGTNDETVAVEEAHLMKKLNPKAKLHLIETNHTFDLVQPWNEYFMPNAFLESLTEIDLFFKQ